MDGNQRPKLGNVLRKIQDSDARQSRDKDKVDDVFDMEIIDESVKPTAGDLMDADLGADFSETVKCFSFSLTGQNKIGAEPNSQKNASVKYNLNLPQVDDLEDSLNQRVSNSSLNNSHKATSFANHLFKGESNNDSEKIDMKSGHFNISSSPSPGQIISSGNQDQRKSIVSFKHESPGDKQKSPKVAAQMLANQLMRKRSPT